VLAGLIVLCGIFGLAIGSFLNVVIYRVPQGMSIVSPGSACPSCGTTIKGRDNVPLLSWILLRGRCRHCREPISGRYPLVELGCAGLFAGTAARFGFAWEVPAFLVLFAGLLALSVIDVERLILPRVIVWPVSAAVSVMLVLASAMTGEWHDLVVGVICGAIWFALFYAMFAVSPKLLGFGDVRLAPVLGLALGWLGVRYVVLGLFAANFFGAAIGIALIGTHRTTRQQQLPYGVFLALGCAFAVFAGPEIVNSFSRV
jgi:leader peptidase (prepilin peptidase)/N-methyltransferase